MLTLLLESTLKGSVILLLAALLARLMRERSAAVRHLTWGLALLAAATLPLGSRLLPVWTVRLPASVGSTLAQPSPGPDQHLQAAGRGPAGGPAAARVEPAGYGPIVRPAPAPAIPPRSLMSVAAAVTLCWGVVAALLLVRLLAGIASMVRLTRRAEPVRDVAWLAALDEARRSAGLSRSVQLLISERAAVPMTWGLARPVLLLPPDYEDWNDERRRAVLIHEVAHVARWDFATQLAAQVSCACYWFNPLVWLAARALRRERERACDDRVLIAGTRASAYAGELLDIARGSLGLAGHGVALAMARSSELEGRLLAILSPGIRRDGPRVRAALLLAAVALVLTLPLAAFRLGPPAAKSESPGPGSSALAAPRADSSGTASSRTVQPAPLPKTTQRTGSGSLAPCNQRSSESKHSHSSVNWSDSGRKSWRVSWSGDGCSVDLVASGEVKFNAEFSDVAEISPGGYLEITVREGETTRRLELRSQAGSLRRTYLINGNTAPYDDAARAWLAGFLIELDRHTAFAVETRFPALLKQGVAAVLDEIDRMNSDYVRGVYYRKLFTSANLAPGEVRRVAQTAGSSIDSDYELGRVLSALAERYSLEDAAVRAAIIAAAGTLESDYERAQLLLVVIAKGGVAPETGHTVVKLVGGMSSDYEKARVLMALGASRQRPLIIVDGVRVDSAQGPQPLASDFLDVVAGMESDYERGRVLKLIVDSGQLSKESLLRVLTVVGRMASDYEAANVLIAMAARNQLPADVKEAYLRAADRLQSDYESQRARAAVREQRRPPA